jgi:hypothetical protein
MNTASRSRPRKIGMGGAPRATNTIARIRLIAAIDPITRAKPRGDSERLGVITASM